MVIVISLPKICGLRDCVELLEVKLARDIRLSYKNRGGQDPRAFSRADIDDPMKYKSPRLSYSFHLLYDEILFYPWILL